MLHITKFYYKGHTFHVLHLDGHYVTVDASLLDEWNRLTVELNGAQMLAMDSVATAIDARKRAVDIDELIDAGMDKMEAFMQVYADIILFVEERHNAQN